MKVVFPGSFDPPTMGHVDLLRRSVALFDEVHVVLGRNVNKAPFLPIEVRLEMLQELIRQEGFAGKAIASIWDGPIVEYALANGCSALVRCIRNEADLPFEQAMASMNLRLSVSCSSSIETLFLIVNKEYADVSSSAVRELVALRRLPEGVVPDVVRKELERHFGPL
jgi:pantetheine-phosphate adenylyltransferase